MVRPQEDVRRLLVGMTQFLYSGSLHETPVVGMHHRHVNPLSA